MPDTLGNTDLPLPLPHEEPVKPRRAYRKEPKLNWPANFKPGRGRISPRQAAFLVETLDGMSLGALVTMRHAIKDKRKRDQFDRAVRSLKTRKLIEVRTRNNRHGRGEAQRLIFATMLGRQRLREFNEYSSLDSAA